MEVALNDITIHNI
jgi:hypothetical protein